MLTPDSSPLTDQNPCPPPLHLGRFHVTGKKPASDREATDPESAKREAGAWSGALRARCGNRSCPSNAWVMREMQDSNLREARGLTNLLLKLKPYERPREAFEKTAVGHYVLETKGV